MGPKSNYNCSCKAEGDLIHTKGEEAVSDLETGIAVATRNGAATESWKRQK